MSTPEMRSFGEELRAFRKRKRMSENKLAQAIGVTRQTIVSWELGKNPPRDRTYVLELAGILDLDDGETNILLAAAFLDPLAPFFVPSLQNPLFIGREEIMQELHSVLLPGTTAVVSQSRAISGLGGIGKTQIALEYAYRYRDDYSAVLWLQADSREIFASECIQLAQELGLPERNESDQTCIVAAFKRWLRGKTKWLLVLDNVEDFPMVEEFLPPGHRGCVLLTTRAQQVTEHIALVHELEGLSKDEGVLLLLHRAGLLELDVPLEQADPASYEQAIPLWELVEGLPLALDQIGAYVRATSCSLTHYRALYEQRRLDLLKLRGKMPPGHKESVATTFSLIFDRVQTINPAATEMLRVCAFLYPKAIPEEIITKAGDQLSAQLCKLSADPLLFDQAVETLQEYSLVHRDARQGTLSIHRLVQAVLQDSLPRHERKEWTTHIITALDMLFPQRVEYTVWSQCERYLPHALACAKTVEQEQLIYLEGASLLNRLGWYLRDRASYDEAEWVLKRALAIREKTLGPRHRTTGDSVNELAHLYFKQGKLKEAEALYERLLSIREGQLVQVASEMMAALNNLADTCRARGKYEKALKLFQRALAISDLYGFDHQWTALVLCNLGLLYMEQGKYREAEPVLRQSLAIRLELFGPDHPDTAISLSNLEELYFRQGKRGAAEQLRQQVLDIDENAYSTMHPATHPEVAFDQARQANYYLEQGDYTRAEPLFQQSLAIQEKELGPHHFHLAATLNDLGRVYQMQRKYAEAEPLLQRALAIREEQLGQEHWQTAMSLNNLALLYLEQGEYELAEPLFLRSLAIKERLDPQHPSTAQGLNNLGGLYSKQGKYELAEPLYWRAFTIREKQLNPYHPDTAESLVNLAHLYDKQGKYEKAESFYRRALAIWVQQIGWDYLRTLLCLHDLVNLYETQGKYQIAEGLLVDTLKAQKQQLGQDHPCTIHTLDALARIYTQQNRYTEAEPLYLQAIAICKVQPSLVDPLRMVQGNYANLLKRTGRTAEAALLELPSQSDE